MELKNMGCRKQYPTTTQLGSTIWKTKNKGPIIIDSYSTPNLFSKDTAYLLYF